MPDSDELDVFTALKYGVEDTVIPEVLTSWGIPFVRVDHRPAHQQWFVEIKVPRSRLEGARRALDHARHIGELLNDDSDK